MFEDAEVVKSGTWFYANSVKCGVRIIKWDKVYGSGDLDDPPEIQNDKEVECYYIQFESLIGKGNYSQSYSYGGKTILEAMAKAEKQTNQKINWD